MISSSQRPLSDNTQHSQQTDIHALGGIRTHNFSRRVASELRLRPRVHWDRQIKLYIFFLVALRPNADHGLLILEVSRSHTTTHYSRLDSSGRVISSSQRPLPNNTKHSQQTDIHALGGIRTHNFSRRTTEDLRLRPRGHWDQQIK